MIFLVYNKNVLGSYGRIWENTDSLAVSFKSSRVKKKCGGMFLENFVEQKDKYCFSCDTAVGERSADWDSFLCRPLFDKIYGGVDRSLCVFPCLCGH